MENGKVIGISTGETIITAITQDGEKSAECLVKVDFNDPEDEYQGSCGNGVYYKIDLNSSTLHIYGNGAMEDYTTYSSTPWYPYRDYITNIIIDQGITHIGTRSFMLMGKISSVNIPQGVLTIGNRAFSTSSLSEVTLPETLISIEENAFYGTLLKEIRIPTSVQEIGYCALGSVDFPIADIYGKSGSAAEQYAKEYGINFFDIALPVYELRYDANGGTFDIEPQRYSEGASVIITKSIPIREGYTFLGWTLDGMLNEEVYSPGDEIVLNDTTTLFAVWSMKPLGITLNKTSMMFNKLDTSEKLEAYLQPSGQVYEKVDWSSSDETIAWVSDSGEVFPKGSGTATITAEIKGFTAECTVEVRIPVDFVTLDRTEVYFTEKNSTSFLKASVFPELAMNKEVFWTSSNPEVASVSPDGMVTALKNGEAVITVTTKDGKKQAKCKVTVSYKTECSHIWDLGYTVDKEATCMKEGEKSIHCCLCDAVKEGSIQPISKKMHNCGNWEIIKEPSYTEYGEKIKKCTLCGSVIQKEEISKLLSEGQESPSNGTITGNSPSENTQSDDNDVAESNQPMGSGSTSDNHLSTDGGKDVNIDKGTGRLPIANEIQENRTVRSTLSSVTFKWKKDRDASAGYRIYVKQGKKYVKVGSIKKSKNTYTLKRIKGKRLTPGTTYKVKVVSLKKIARKIREGREINLTIATKSRAPIITYGKRKNSSSITLKWKKIKGISGYEIQMSRKKNSNFKKVANIKAGNISYKKLGVKKTGKPCYFRIRTYKNVTGGKVYSSWSKVKSVK